MANTCTICKHEKRNDIDLLLIQGKSLRLIGNQFDVGYKAVERHRNCVQDILVQWHRRRDVQLVSDIKTELMRCINRVNKLFDACDAQLSDPDDPDSYTLAPTAEQIEVIYNDFDGKKPVRRKGLLSELMARFEKKSGLQVDSVRVKRVDASKRLLEASKLLSEQLERVGERFGLFNQTLDKDRLIALRSGVVEIQRRLSQEYGRDLSWNETIDEVLKHNHETSNRPYLEKLREDEEDAELISKSVM